MPIGSACTAPRAGRRAMAWLSVVALTAGCASAAPTTPLASPAPVSPEATAAAAASEVAVAAPEPSPTPTPPPTPRYTNEADPELSALIPESVAGVPVIQPAVDEFALTPGDVGAVYGEIGVRFESLVIAYTEEPRTTLYAVRVRGGGVRTEELRPYLAQAAQYVGISGLHPEAWSLLTVDPGHIAWQRPEDNATAAGTTIYTWAADEFVFLLIGTDDALNRALVAALPGEPAETPAPRATGGALPIGASPAPPP
jgi:hypothetical protein